MSAASSTAALTAEARPKHHAQDLDGWLFPQHMASLIDRAAAHLQAHHFPLQQRAGGMRTKE